MVTVPEQLSQEINHFHVYRAGEMDITPPWKRLVARVSIWRDKIQLQKPAQPIAWWEENVPRCLLSGRNFHSGLRRDIHFHQKFLGLEMAHIQVKNASLGKKNLPKCPDYLVNETCKLLLAQSSFPSMPHNYSSAAVIVYALNLS